MWTFRVDQHKRNDTTMVEISRDGKVVAALYGGDTGLKIISTFGKRVIVSRPGDTPPWLSLEIGEEISAGIEVERSPIDLQSATPPSCRYQGCRWEETIEAKEWRTILEWGYDQDVGRGGMWEPRSGALNLWCSPEDKPSNWEKVSIRPGSFPAPRERVAAFYGEHLEASKLPDAEQRALARNWGFLPTVPSTTMGGEVRIHLVVSPSCRVEEELHQSVMGGVMVEEGGVVVHKSIEDLATTEEVEWCLQKWQELKGGEREPL